MVFGAIHNCRSPNAHLATQDTRHQSSPSVLPRRTVLPETHIQLPHSRTSLETYTRGLQSGHSVQVLVVLKVLHGLRQQHLGAPLAAEDARQRGEVVGGGVANLAYLVDEPGNAERGETLFYEIRTLTEHKWTKHMEVTWEFQSGEAVDSSSQSWRAACHRSCTKKQGKESQR